MIRKRQQPATGKKAPQRSRATRPGRSGPAAARGPQAKRPAKKQPSPPAPTPSQQATLALVGRPNVGKSSLFNRLVGGRPALVQDEPGITRDRRYGTVQWTGATLQVIDTGGLDPSADGILGAMRSQTLRAVDEAQVLVLVVDAQEGITGLDTDVARLLRSTGKPVLIAANKVDTAAREAAAADAHRLGFPDVFPLSASHGRGVSDLLDAVVAHLAPGRTSPMAPPEDVADPSDPPIRLAFVGKPNAGKSSLVNALLGEDRVLVHDQPGTTRDPIDTPFSFRDRQFVLVDTAGLRRRRVVKTLTEAVAAKMARDQVEKADVAALVIDLSTGAGDEDARLANLIEESGRAMVLVLNKTDRIARSDLNRQVEAVKEKLAFVSWVKVVTTSARTGRGVIDVVQAAARAFMQWRRRVPTPELNRHLEMFVKHRPPPAGPSGRHVRLYFMTQAENAPPTFYVSTNMPAGIGHPYRRYLLNQLRKAYGFEGTPMRIVMRGKRTEARKTAPKQEGHGKRKRRS